MRESAVRATLPAAVPTVERMLPNVLLVKAVLGSENCGWLNRLKNSPRNWKLRLSCEGMGVKF